MSGWISLWAHSRAATMTSSGTNWASPSTITTESREAAMTMARSLASISFRVGFSTNSPFTRPMRAPATGPSKGMGEMDSAAEAPVRASTSLSFSWSAEMTLARICTSSRKPLVNRGRTGRSMRRETRVSRSLGRPISRRKKLPGMRPAAYIFSE